MPIEYKLLTEAEYPVWDEFVKQQSQGSFFHSSKWLGFYNTKRDILIATENGTILGGIAMARIKKLTITGYHILPFSPYYGPVLADEIVHNISKTQEVLQVLIDQLPASPVYDFVLPPGHQSIHPWVWNGFDVSVYVSHIISREVSAEEYQKGIAPGKKRDLATANKLLKQGEIILKTGNDILPDLVNLIMDTSKTIGYRNPEEALRKIITFGSIKCIGIYHPQHGLISGNILFEDEKTVVNLFNGTKRIKDPKLSIVNVLNMNESILYALNQGKSFDFEGSMLKGVEKFYRAMGGQTVPVYRVTRSGSVLYNMFRALKRYKAGIKK